MSDAKTMKRLALASAIGLLFGAGAALGQSSQNPSTGTQSAQGAPSGGNAAMGAGGQAAGGALNKSDQRLMTEMAQANLAEIEAGRIAQEKTQNEQVRTFAQQMVDDHTKALQDLQQLAQAKGVTLPDRPDNKHKKMAEKLGALSGASFDRRYVEQSGTGDHKKTHSLLQRVQSHATDPDLKALAAKMQPVVDQHLNTVQQLTAAVKGRGAGKAGTAAGTSGTSGATGSSGSPDSSKGGSSGGNSGGGYTQPRPGT